MVALRIQTEPFAKALHKTAAEAVAGLDLSPEGRALLLPDLSPQGFLALLADGEHFGDAIRTLAFLLPVREGAWWACVTAGAALAAPSAAEVQCLERCAAWVYAPDEERRYACMDAAEAAQLNGPAAYAALAAFWSGGSLAPAGLPDAPADPRLGPIAVGASVLLAISAGPPLQLKERFAAALARGMDIANGGNGRREGDRTPGPA